MKLVYANIVSIVSVIAAGAMALYDKPGWGWFLFIALICSQGWDE
jgi:hypothetical protein